MENPANSYSKYFSSFFQNSSPGNSAKKVPATEDSYENNDWEATQPFRRPSCKGVSRDYHGKQGLNVVTQK